MNQETKVGLFLLTALAVIMGSILFLGKVRIFQGSSPYFIEFTDVEALPPKAPVKIAGVEIGTVHRVELINGKARVTVHIDTNIPLYADAEARIGSTGIIGSRFVELAPGKLKSDLLVPGSTLQGISGGSLNEMISRLSGLFQDDHRYGNAVDNLKATLANIRNVSESLNKSIGQRSKDLQSIVSNIRDITESGKVFVQHLEEVSTARKDDVKVALKKFRDVSEKLDNLLAKVERGEGTIGALVSDEQTAKDVKKAITSIKDTAVSAKEVLGRFRAINTYWNYRFRYDTRDDEGRSDVVITFVPRPGKYYAIGATHLGKPISSEKKKEYERKNRITGIMGADYGPFTGYAGVIRSEGGVGLNFRPLWFIKNLARRVELNVEAFDFNRDKIVRGQRIEGTHLSAGGHVALTRWLWVGARGEDLLERGAFMGYTNIVFRDEDLAYLLGLASVSR